MKVLRNWLKNRLAGSDRVERELAALHAFAAEARDIYFHLASDGRAVYASPSLARVLGYDPATFVGRDPIDIVVDEDRAGLIQAITDFIARADGVEMRQRVRVRHANGSLLWVEGSAVAKQDLSSVVLVLRDVSDRVRIEEELAALALQDALTGLANRRAFDQTLGREWLRTRRDSAEMSLLLLDLDHFKQFNDGYGHQAGDDCLRSVAHCIRSLLLRPGDLACRYGGEELAVILGGTGREGAEHMAERLRAGVEALRIPHAYNGGNAVVTVSIGAATAMARIGGTMRMPEGILQAADHALYRAKHEGRNRASHTLLITPVE